MKSALLALLFSALVLAQTVHQRTSFMPHSVKAKPLRSLPPLDREVMGDTENVGFDQATALRFLMYSYAAYQYDSLIPWQCSYCTYYGPSSSFVATQTFWDSTTDARGFIGYNSAYSEIVISFRGSSSLQNWIEDLKIYKDHTPFGGGSGSVATGFYQFYMALQSGVLQELANLVQQFPNYNVFVTGHSLGAAASNICAMDLTVNQQYANVNVINFGCPRVGDSDYSDFVAERLGNTTRMTHNADIVPHLPPQAFNFEHESQEIWDTANGYTLCSGDEDPNCSDSVPFFDYSISDHLSYMGVSCCNGPDQPISVS